MDWTNWLYERVLAVYRRWNRQGRLGLTPTDWVRVLAHTMAHRGLPTLRGDDDIAALVGDLRELEQGHEALDHVLTVEDRDLLRRTVSQMMKQLGAKSEPTGTPIHYPWRGAHGFPATAAELASDLCGRLLCFCQGVPAEQLALLTGTPVSQVRDYLLGESAPTAAFVASLCEGLQISTCWMLLGEGKPFLPVAGSARNSSAVAAACDSTALQYANTVRPEEVRGEE